MISVDFPWIPDPPDPSEVTTFHALKCALKVKEIKMNDQENIAPHQLPTQPIEIPLCFQQDGPLVSRIEADTKRTDDEATQHYRRECQNCLAMWYSNYRQYCQMPHYSPTDALYNALCQDRGISTPGGLLEAAFAIAFPEKFAKAIFSYVSLRKYIAHRASAEKVLGDLVPDRFVQAANHAERWDYYHANGTDGNIDFSRVDDAAIYLHKRSLTRTDDAAMMGIPTGIPELDEATSGLNGTVIIGGEGGVGKSSLAQSFGLATLKAHSDRALIIHQFDMPKEAAIGRVICELGGVTEREILARNLPADRQEAVDKAIATYREHSPRIDIVPYLPGEPIDVEKLIKRRNKFLKACGCSQAVVIVDYLQLIGVPEGVRDANEADKQRIVFLQSLRKSRIHNPCSEDVILAISEVRKTDGNNALALSDLLGSSRLGYAADLVMMLQAGKSEPGIPIGDRVPLDLNVVKVRRGRKAKIRLAFDYLRYQFTSLGNGGLTLLPRRSLDLNRNPIG